MKPLLPISFIVLFSLLYAGRTHGQAAADRMAGVARGRMAKITRVDRSMGIEPVRRDAKTVVKPYYGPTFIRTSDGVISQVDAPEQNEQIWGVYGPGVNIVRDIESGEINIAWSNTYVTAPPPGGSCLIAHAISRDNGQIWDVDRNLDEQSAIGRAYCSVINQAYSAMMGIKSIWIAYVERESQRVVIIDRGLPGFQFLDYETIVDVSDQPANVLAFTFMASGDNAAGSSNIYVSVDQTGGQDSLTQDNILFVKTTDGGASWSNQVYIFGDEPGQVPYEYSVNNGNYCALAMAVDHSNAEHIGGVFISNNIPDEDLSGPDSLFHLMGKGESDYQWWFIESFDAGDSWSTPEMVLPREPLERMAFHYTVEWDSSGDGNPDMVTDAYPLGGAMFWPFLYEPVFTDDGFFHIATMPALFEDPNGEQVGIGTNYNTAIYARRDPDGAWHYNHDWGEGSTTLRFDENLELADPRFGQVWFAQVAKAHDNNDVVAVSWSSRLQAYAECCPTANGYPNMGPWVYAYSPDGGDMWSEARAYFPEIGLPTGTDSTDGGWMNSSSGLELWTDDKSDSVYHFDLFWISNGVDNVTLHEESDGVWYSSEPSFRADPIVSVSSSGEPFAGFQLAQNFPNPFNPETVISYTIPRASNVTLTIYNILGEEVTRLVDGRVSAGMHEVVWDASGVASGVYFFRLETEAYAETKKMLVLK